MGSAPRREAVFGRYELLCLLATGGMASVHLARAAGIGGFEKLLVIKRILPHAAHDQSFVQMFLDEARIAATLDHSNLAQVFDVGTAQGDVFLAMEFLHGHDLRAIVRSVRGPLPLDPTIAIVVGVCAGLHYAHEKRGASGKLLGLVHRDVSPSNIVVTYAGSVKVIDFGIAKATNRLGETTSGVLKGKPGYMSPEQCLGETEVDRRSDVFCVGIVLYELTTGTKLFRSRGAEYAQLRAIVEDEIAPPSSLVAGYPGELERIVLRALRRKPDERYATALELQRDLERFAVSARLDVSPTRLAKFMEETFHDELQAWRTAEQSGVSLAEHVVTGGQARRPSASRLSTEEGAPTLSASQPYAPTLTAPNTAATKRELPPASDRPRAASARPPKARKWPWLVVAAAAAAVVGGTIAASTWWPHARAQPASTPATAVAPSDPLAAARAAERDGKLELAIAHYLESYDAHADPETLFRIGELYERLDRATDAVIYFQRYLELAPTAHDRDAVTARIARLRPAPVADRAAPPFGGAGGRAQVPAVDAGTVAVEHPAKPVGVTHPVNKPIVHGEPETATTANPAQPATSTTAHCHCVVAKNDPKYHNEWLCKRVQKPLCFCGDPKNWSVGLCPTPFEHCEGSGCTLTWNSVQYKCTDPDEGTFHLHRTPGAACTGFRPADDSGTELTGSYTCSACAVFPRTATWKAEQFEYSGAAGETCTGYARSGEAMPGQLACDGS